MISKIKSKSVLRADLKVAIIGPSGYTGHEIIRILLKHPKVKIKLLIGNKSEGKNISEIFSSLSQIDLPKIKSLKAVNFSNIDIVFSCMPSGNLDSIIHLIPKYVVIIDLSADFRIKDVKLFEKYYTKHQNPMYLKIRCIKNLGVGFPNLHSSTPPPPQSPPRYRVLHVMLLC